MTWDCLYCGLETTEPDAHLRRAHGTTVDEVIANLERAEAETREQEAWLMTLAALTE